MFRILLSVLVKQSINQSINQLYLNTVNGSATRDLRPANSEFSSHLQSWKQAHPTRIPALPATRLCFCLRALLISVTSL